MQIRRFAPNSLAALILVVTWGCTELMDDHNVHPDNWSIEHQTKVRTARYDLTFCKSCHGDDLKGTDAVPSCQTYDCHLAPRGVAACDNCHASEFSPFFEDLAGRTDSRIVTVGAHTSHDTNPDSLTANVDCASCHTVPDSAWAAGHIDASPYAEVIFDTLATNDNSLTPVWDRQNATCADTYCHGNFQFEKAASSNDWIYADSLIVGNNQTVVWTDSLVGENLCATCHSYPPTGHMSLTTCGGCHTSVVGTDHLSIIDTQKHINGRVDYP